jgi:tetraacyldisaccharide-1-P 4'-kinase
MLFISSGELIGHPELAESQELQDHQLFDPKHLTMSKRQAELPLEMRLKDANKSNAHQANAKRCTFYTKCCSFRAVSLFRDSPTVGMILAVASLEIK